MKMLTQKLMAVVASVVLLFTASNLQAQKKTTAGKSSGSDTSSNDAAFVKKNIKDNQMEVQLSQLAVDKSTDDKIKDLAQKMVNDHTAMLQALQKFNKDSDSGAGAADSTNSGLTEGNDSMGMGNMHDTSGKGMNRSDTSGRKWNKGDSSHHWNKSDSSHHWNKGDSSHRWNNGDSSHHWNKGDSSHHWNNSDSSHRWNKGDSSHRWNRGDSSHRNRNDSSRQGNMSAGRMEDTDSANSMDHHKEMGSMSPLANAKGEEFDRMWVSDMLAAHKAKLTELSAAATSVKDPELKKVINQAIPKVRMHRDALSALKKGSGKAGTNKKGKASNANRNSSASDSSATNKEQTTK